MLGGVRLLLESLAWHFFSIFLAVLFRYLTLLLPSPPPPNRPAFSSQAGEVGDADIVWLVCVCVCVLHQTTPKRARGLYLSTRLVFCSINISRRRSSNEDPELPTTSGATLKQRETRFNKRGHVTAVDLRD